MGVDTHGKIKGHIKYEEIFNFIRQKYDKNALCNIKKSINSPLEGCDWRYKINEHSEDNENWYMISGRIDFNYHGEERSLFYVYDNLNSYENINFYSEHGLSVEIVKEIVAHFGGGWVDENDCDDKEYYPVELNTDGNIKPVQYVTMADIYEKFGSVVVITG